MQLDGCRKDLLRDHKHTRIRDQHRIDAGLCQLLKVGTDAIEIIIVCEDVRRDEDLHLMCMCVGDTLADLLQCKVFCIGPKTEGLAA